MPATDLAGGTMYIKDISGVANYSIDNRVTYNPIQPVFRLANSSSTVGKVIFETDITFNLQNNYFMCITGNIQFGSESLNPDGSRPIITIDNVTDYPGLIQNGTNSENGFNDISIFNIVVNEIGSTLLNNSGGWIGQEYFGKGSTGNRIINCQSSGNINVGCGGILGANSNGVVINACAQFGTIDFGGGGIAGPQSTNLNISKCISFGNITNGSSGGILGLQSQNCSITNCYSAGDIDGYGGGIVGNGANGITVTNSYSIGSIGISAGGIFASNASSCTATNCHTSGSIGINAGGIFGASSASCVAANCYTSGLSTGIVGGIFSGDNTDGISNFSEANNSNSGTWNDINANSVLQNVGTVNGVWFTDGINNPYKLLIGGSPYLINNIDIANSRVYDTYTTSVLAGESTTEIIVPGYTSSIIVQSPASPALTINGTTGAVSTTSVPPGSYTLIIYSTTMGSYLITKMDITITSSGGGGGSVYNTFARSLGSVPSLVTSARASFAISRSQIGKPLKFNSYEGYLKYKKAINDTT